ncbi:FecR family protein [Sphingobacterium spiritivorum]|uniref:FecR family protein n=1 Tax=Sphingobacterium spiritivorum TaxID=258 RepID=UPI003DA340C2
MKTRIRYLLRQYFYNHATHEELVEFFDMVRSARYDDELSVLLKELYEELKREDPSLTFVDTEGNLMELPDKETVDSTHVKVSHRSSVSKWAVSLSAAIVVLLFSWGAYRIGEHTENGSSEEYVQVIKEAANDENKVLHLADGTTVWLNGSSRLEYPQEFEKDKPREVTLIGEAYFEVHKAADWPFIVHTGSVRTTVVGTQFNVKAYPGMKDVMVAVKSGKVKVSKNDKLLAVLQKDQELRVPVVASVQQGKEHILTDKIAGNWKEGYLEYEDETIESVLLDLQRIYQIEIILEKKEIANKDITLSVRKDSGALQVLDILCALTASRLKTDNRNYIIY